MADNQKTKRGMYGETPRVQVGEFSISRQSENSVWIEMTDGEGGEFSEDLFEECIRSFYDMNF